MCARSLEEEERRRGGERRERYLGAASLEYTIASDEARRIVQYNTCTMMSRVVAGEGCDGKP